MAAVAEKYPKISDNPLTVERVSFSDIEQSAPWIAKKMQRRTALATPQAVLTWLRCCLPSNDIWFVRSPGQGEIAAIGMAELVRRPLRAPMAEEIFVFAREGGVQAAADLYAHLAMWANRLDCYRLDVDLFTDVPRGEIEKRLGKLNARGGGAVLF